LHKSGAISGKAVQMSHNQKPLATIWKVSDELWRVVLQKLIKDRKLPGKGINYAATPKIWSMKLIRSATAPFLTPLICPFLTIFIISYPLIVRRAVLKDLNPIPGLTNRFIERWSCSTMLLRYFFA